MSKIEYNPRKRKHIDFLYTIIMELHTEIFQSAFLVVKSSTVANTAFRNSNLDVDININGLRFTSGTIKTTDEIYNKFSSSKNSSGKNNIIALKETANADFVVFIGEAVKVGDGHRCGITAIGQQANFEDDIALDRYRLQRSFALIGIPADGDDCKLSKTFVHELGHAMGLDHPINMEGEDSNDGITEDAYGYGSINNTVTIMGYRHKYGKNATEIPRFSEDGVLVEGDEIGSETANAVRAARITAKQVANIYN